MLSIILMTAIRSWRCYPSSHRSPCRSRSQKNRWCVPNWRASITDDRREQSPACVEQDEPDGRTIEQPCRRAGESRRSAQGWPARSLANGASASTASTGCDDRSSDLTALPVNRTRPLSQRFSIKCRRFLQFILAVPVRISGGLLQWDEFVLPAIDGSGYIQLAQMDFPERIGAALALRQSIEQRDGLHALSHGYCAA